MKKSILIIAGALVLSSLSAFASDIKTYPVQGVFLADTISNPNFVNLVKKEARTTFIPKFMKEFNDNFDNAVQAITNKNKNKTIVSYLSIPRASFYQDKKPSGIEYFLPITTSLNFVNITSGEVLYSTSSTVYEQTQENDIENFNKLYIDAYNRAVGNVVKSAKSEFHPFEISTKIVDRYKNLYILDKGLDSGISNEDLLTDDDENQMVIIYSTMGYSIGKILFGDEVQKNDLFTKQSNSAGVGQVKKIKVLLLNDVKNVDIYDLFATSLGQNSKMNLVLTNPTYNKMKSTVVGLNKEFNAQNVYQKNLPNYFLSVEQTIPVKTSFKMNLNGLESAYFQVMGCGTIFDKTGRIVFSQCVNEQTEPRYNYDEFNVSDETMLEILRKNMTDSLAQKINEKIVFKDFQFKVKNVNSDTIELEDKYGVLNEGNIVGIYKNVKSENGTDYLVPTFDYEVLENTQGIALCRLSNFYVDGLDKPNKDDIAAITMVVANNGTNFYKIDNNVTAIDGNVVEVGELDKVVLPAIASGFSKPVVVQDETIMKTVSNVNSSGMFNKKMQTVQNISDLKIVPSYKIELFKHAVKGLNKIDTYDVTAILEIYKGEQKISQNAVSQDVTLTLPLKGGERTLKHELRNALYDLFISVAKGLK